jgi:hypothetical protein
LDRRRRLASGKRRPDVCSSSVTDSSGVPWFREENAAGFKLEAAVLKSLPNIVRGLGEFPSLERRLGIVKGRRRVISQCN